jgi:hypothetical protein
VRGSVVLLLFVGTAVTACGRREEPSWFDARPAPAAATAAAPAKPLPPSAFQVRWGALAFPRTVDADVLVPVTVSITNASDITWPDKTTADPQKKDGSYAVRLTHTWVRADVAQDGRRRAERTDLPRPVMPGGSIDVPLTVRTPAEPGEYWLEIELIQELVVWFKDKGAEGITVPVHVVAAGKGPPDTRSSR